MKAFDSLQTLAKTYMADMGVPKHIQDAVLGTPSDKGLLIDEKTIKTYFWGAIPYRHEWMLNRCSQLTGYENERLKNFDQLIEQYGKEWPGLLGSAETQKFLFLSKKRLERASCVAATEAQAQAEAYQKFFGVRKSSR